MAEWIKAEILTQDVLQRRIDKLAKFLELAEVLSILVITACNINITTEIIGSQ